MVTVTVTGLKVMGPIDGALATIDIATLDTGHFKPVWIDFGLNNLNSGSLTGYGVAFNDDVSGSNNSMFRYYYYADDDDHMIGDLTSVNLVSGDAIGVTAFNTPGDGWNYIVGWYRHNGVWRAISMRHDNRYTDGGSYGIGCTGSTVRLSC